MFCCAAMDMHSSLPFASYHAIMHPGVRIQILCVRGPAGLPLQGFLKDRLVLKTAQSTLVTTVYSPVCCSWD